jgi:hypothetical protein
MPVAVKYKRDGLYGQALSPNTWFIKVSGVYYAFPAALIDLKANGAYAPMPI